MYIVAKPMLLCK